MEQRVLGRDLKVSALGLGCMGFSHAYGAPTDRTEAIRLIQQAADIILDAVDQTNQTFADRLRESGDFTKENQKKALEMSLKASLAMMNDEMIKTLEKEFNDAEAWIASKIEAACKANNENKGFIELK